jgi:hypothetical protein
LTPRENPATKIKILMQSSARAIQYRDIGKTQSRHLDEADAPVLAGFRDTNLFPSSTLISLYTSQVMQENCLSVKVPWTFPPQSVPAIAQQILPPFCPPFNSLADLSVAAEQTPNSETLEPIGCLPQFFNSQQFFFKPISPPLLPLVSTA